MSDHLLLSLPVLVPLATLALCAVFWKHTGVQRVISLIGSVALLVSATALLMRVFGGEILVTQFGSWRAPFGISFVADLFAAAMVMITGIMAVAVSVYGLTAESKLREQAFYHPLYHGLLMGVAGAFLTGDIFNLYVWFEVMLISSFGLLVVGGKREQLDAGVKYVVLNLLVTTLFLMTIGFLYGLTGTLNMADLARVLPTVENQGLVTTLAVMFLLAFGSKAALFPLYFWLPASYHSASAPVIAIFAALLTKVGVYAIIRTFTLLFWPSAAYTGPIIGVVAALTMITGVLGAASHFDVRRILSFHIISQIGYMLIGLFVGTPLAIAAAILYVLHHIIVKANLFLIAGVLKLATGTYDLKKMGGLQRTAPLLAFLFAIPALSLAGMPPLSGFWAKFMVIDSSLDAGHGLMAFIALAVGVLTLYSMVKIWNEAFWKSPPDQAKADQAMAHWRSQPAARWAMLLPIAALGAITLTIGLMTEPFVAFSIRAAEQLLNPAAYIDAVLGPVAQTMSGGR